MTLYTHVRIRRLAAARFADGPAAAQAATAWPPLGLGGRPARGARVAGAEQRSYNFQLLHVGSWRRQQAINRLNFSLTATPPVFKSLQLIVNP